MIIFSSFDVELNNGFSSDSEENVFSSIWNEYERVIMQSLISSFGLDLLAHDQHGGDSDTIHNVRKISKNPNMNIRMLKIKRIMKTVVLMIKLHIILFQDISK